MRIGRYLLKNLKHHRLIDLANNYNIKIIGNHRLLKDCEITLEAYNSMLKYESTENFLNSCKRVKTKLDIREIKTDNIEFDISHPLYNKCCVFYWYFRENVKKRSVADLGGVCSNNIMKETNF